MPRLPRTLLVPLAILIAWLVAAVPAEAQRPLEVWAAVSARGLVEDIARDHAVDVVVRADATSRIVRQVEAGAPAEVLVTADRSWMSEAVSRGLVDAGAARLIALNRVVVFERAPSAPSSLPTVISELTDQDFLRRVTAGSEPLLVVAGPDVPIGRYARQALAGLGVEGSFGDRTVSVANARAVVVTVLSGEVALGIGYLSDALNESDLRVVGQVPASMHAPAEVWAAPVAGARAEAGAFVATLAGASASNTLGARGFAAPPADVTLARVGASAREASPQPPLGPVLGRTVIVGLLAVLLATLPAVLLGRWLARSRSRWRGPVGTALLLPLVLPPVVTGFVLLALLGSSGVFGPLLAAAGIRLSFTLGAAVIAAAVVGFPLYAVVVRNAFEAVDPRYEELAWTLGSPPRSTFRRVALPLALPGVAAGAVLALARGLGEFGATVVVAGNIEGETQTLALAVYQLLESPDGRGRIWAFVGASVVIAALGLAAWEWLGARHRARLLDGGHR